jgi:N-acetyl-anhydromuramyl-L-alanine amidase AmpD
MRTFLPALFIFLFLSSTANDLLVENPYSQSFKKAYALYPSVPKGILEAVAYTQTRFNHLTGEGAPSCIDIPRAYSVMGLTEDGKGYFRNSLSFVSDLSGFSEKAIKKNAETSIIAYAAAFNAIQKQVGNFSKNPADYKLTLIALSELPLHNDNINEEYVMNVHLYQLFWFLSNGEFQDVYDFPDHHLNLQEIFGENYGILSSSSVKISKSGIISESGQRFMSTSSTLSPDYPPAIYTPAASCNYSSRAGTLISAVTIHDVEGTYAGCISWFQNCSASVSAHYVLRSSDGQVTQMVLEASKAWHVGTENGYTIGLEHEGYNNTASWYTNAMYASSANLVKDICTDNGINPLRCYYGPGCTGSSSSCGLGACTKIKGHQMFPNQTHDDPGPYWNWDKYYKLINNTYTITTTFTASTGNFYDSGGASANYSDDERKVYLFTKPGATNITLNFSMFNVEQGWDYLFLYDGGSINSTLIGKYTGTVNPGPVTSTNDSLLVEFRSDCATNAAGWAASYTTVTTATTSADVTSPTTSVTTLNAWKTTSFTATFNDVDNVGGSGVEKGYYQVIDYNGTEWRANYTDGFFADNFDNAIHPEWTQKAGTWTVTGNSLVQTDETSAAANNTNIYAKLTENLSNRYLYHFLGKFEGAGTNRRAGLHFFCDQPDSSNRNNSYFVWFRLDDQKVQIYKVVNNNFGLPVYDQPLAFTAGQWYDIKIIYDRITGKINVYMNNAKVATWTDSSPYSNGGYISFRSGNCKFSIDEIKVYRSRSTTANVTIGSGNAYDIRYQNPNPLTNSAKIKSICQDSAGNLSPIFYHDLNVDWTPPSNIAFINDGKTSDISVNCNNDSLSANWGTSADTNSAIAKYWYSVGTSPGATNILNWTSNWGNTTVTSNTLTLTQNTVYYFNVKAEDGAGLMSNVISSNGQKVDTTCALLGVNELSIKTDVQIYPNPFTQDVTIRLSKVPDVEIKVSMTDALGKRILSSSFENHATSKTINTSHLAQGVYYVKIESGKESIVKEIVKE